MERILAAEPSELKEIEGVEVTPPPELARTVNLALEALPAEYREVIIQRIYMGLSFGEIARQIGISERQVETDLYEAKRRLRCLLADFVLARWGVETDTICRFCGHPKAKQINSMLRKKKNSESWGSFGKRLSEAIGERIGPPRTLIAHMKHIKRNPREAANG